MISEDGTIMNYMPPLRSE